MKIRIGLIAAGCLMALASPGFAQGLTGGVKIGASMASLKVENEEGVYFKTKTGVVAGVFIGIPVTDMFSIQPEVLYAQKGAKLEGGGETGKVKLDYLEIPILGVISLGSGGSSPYIVIGPSFGVKMNAKLEVGGQEETDFDDEVKKGDVGLVLGAGAKLSRFLVEARYNLGLTNVAEAGDEVKNRAFSFLVGVGF